MFKIAIIGRPNVGKSTLFNALTNKNLAIVEDIQGTTRDRKISKGSLIDIDFELIDTGGFIKDNTMLTEDIWKQSEKAILESNYIIFMIDGQVGPTPDDKILATKLKKSNKPVLLCVNKTEKNNNYLNSYLAYELGFSNLIPISAKTKIGFNDIYDNIFPIYQEFLKNNENQENDKPLLSIAVVGKPNVGKSTLINRLLKEERLITGDIAGITRDSISCYLNHNNNIIKLVDTAGLRRQTKVTDNLEKMSTQETIKTIIFANTVFLVISAEEGLTKQDFKIAQKVIKEGRSLIIIVNKTDLIDKYQHLITEINLTLEETFSDVKNIKIIPLSALKQNNINHILDEAILIYNKWNTQIQSSIFNKWLTDVTQRNPAPIIDKIRLKIKFGSQIKTRPPTFKLWTNLSSKIPPQYLKYLKNEMCKSFKLDGIPIRIISTSTKNPYLKS